MDAVEAAAPPVPASRAELRPHFDLWVALPPDEALARLGTAFNEPAVTWEGDMRGSHVQLMVPEGQRNLWSPWLTFEVNAEDHGTLFTGRFAPHPSVWTMYMAMYAIIGFSALGLAFFGLSQWIAGQAPTALWALPVGAVLAALLYGLAFVGQGLTAQQMCGMRSFVAGLFEDAGAEWRS